MFKAVKVFTVFLMLFSTGVFAKEPIKAFFFTTESVYMNHVKTTLDKMAKQRGYPIKIFDAEDSAKKQYEQFQDNISIGDLAVIEAEDDRYLKQMISAAEDLDVRVVIFGDSPSYNLKSSYDKSWYVGFEMFDSARKQFNLIKKYLETHPDYDKNKNGLLDVIFLQGKENNYPTHVRTHFVLENFENISVKINPISYNFDNYSYAEGYEDVSKQIRDFGLDNIEMIISNNDAMALGALKALNERKYNFPYSFQNGHRHIPVFGIDGISEALKAVESGMLTGTVLADYSALSRVIMLIFENVNYDEFQKIVWFNVKDRTIFIPYREISKIKDYNALSLTK